MVFTNKWAKANFKTWRELLPKYFRKDAKYRVLEIGSFEGQSIIFLMSEIFGSGSTALCIDPWSGNVGSTDKTYARFIQNVTEANLTHVILASRGPFERLFRGGVEGKFDFIYIDGDHEARAVLRDAVLAWEILESGGIMLFDDYLWANHRGADRGKLPPKSGIDCFLECYGPVIEVLHTGRQVMVRKCI